MDIKELIACLKHCAEDKNSCEDCMRFTKNVGSMKCTDNLLLETAETLEALQAELAEREKAVIQLRKQWTDAEMHICTMCGHFNHKTDGNIVYGNMNCGEIVGYPYCAGKFTPWIPVKDRLPETIPSGAGTAYSEAVVVWTSGRKAMTAVWNGERFLCDADYWEAWGEKITHWMPLRNFPTEVE